MDPEDFSNLSEFSINYPANFERFLKNPLGYILFRKFLSNERSENHLDFWWDVEDFYNLKDWNQLEETANKIFHK